MSTKNTKKTTHKKVTTDPLIGKKVQPKAPEAPKAPEEKGVYRSC